MADCVLSREGPKGALRLEPRVKLPYYPPALSTYFNDEAGATPGARVNAGLHGVAKNAKAAGAAEQDRWGSDSGGAGGHHLYQEAFFFCSVPNVGDVPGTGSIYVETVVDRESGCAFARVYPAKNALNAADILSTRVFPFFRRQGFTIENLRTPRKPEYFGLVSLHPFEILLAASHIHHRSTNDPGAPVSYLCLQFYRFLQKELFQPVLRKTFHFTLDQLQKELDKFVDAYNALQLKHWNQMKTSPQAGSKFPFEL